MQLKALGMAGLLLALAATFARAAEDPAALVGQLGSGDARARVEARQRLVALGVPALGLLFASFPSGDPAADGEVRSLVGTIVLRAPQPRGETDPVVERLREQLDPERPRAARILAVRLLGSRGRDECVSPLARLLSEPALAEDARQALAQIPGERATRALAEATQHATGEWRLALLRTLGERRDPAAFPTLRGCARDWDADVIATAIEALGRLGVPDAVPYVRRALTDRSGKVRRAAAQALLAIADACERRGQQREGLTLARDVLASDTGASDAERIGALSLLGRLGTPEVLPLAIPCLRQGPQPVRVAAAMAVHAVPQPEATRALAEALPGAPLLLQYTLVRVLGERRDPAAFPAIAGLANADDAGLRILALRAMANTGDVRAVSPLALALTDASPEIHRAAVEANLRLGDALLAQGKPAEAARSYHCVFDSEPGERERRAALEGMARAASPDSLDRVRQVLAAGPQSLQEVALNAAFATAASLDARGEREAAIRLFEELLDSIRTGPRAAEVARKLRALGREVDLAQRQGFIANWWLLGPIPNVADSAWGLKLAPEEGVSLQTEIAVDGRKLRWQRHHSEDDQGIVHYDRLFPEPDEKAVYAYTEFAVEQAQDATVKVGSDDSVICWVNGRRVIETRAIRGLKVDEESAPVRLEKGTNRILLKVLNGTGSWASCVRLVGADGRPLRFRFAGERENGGAGERDDAKP